MPDLLDALTSNGGRDRVEARRQALDTVLDDVAAHYDVGHWWDVQPVGSGFRITAEAGDFLVAVSSGARSDTSLRFEAMLLSHLADKAYRAPRLVRTRAGRPWHRSMAGVAALVSEWVSGGAVDASLAQHRRRSMRALAEYHSAVRSFPPRLRAGGGPTLHTLERKGPAALEAFTGISAWYLDADGRQVLRNASSYLWRQYLRAPELIAAGGATLPRLVIHGGFGRDAVLLDGCAAAGPADGVAGFERARYDRRAVDLAAALTSFAGASGGLDLDRCAELVGAYVEVDPLSPGEVEAVPLVLRAERLVRVFHLTCRVEDGLPESLIEQSVQAIDDEAVHLHWLEEHEGALVDALGSALVA